MTIAASVVRIHAATQCASRAPRRMSRNRPIAPATSRSVPCITIVDEKPVSTEPQEGAMKRA